MTVREMQGAIGKMVLYLDPAGALQFVCLVKDAKVSFGQPRVLIVPAAGLGERWVEFSSIRPMPQVNNGQVSTNSSQKNLTLGVISAIVGTERR
jgi:hypothetical protein